MSACFSFKWIYEGSDRRLDFSVLFKPPGYFSPEEIASDFERQIQTVQYPDIVSLFVLDVEFEDVRHSLSSAVLQQALDRASTKIAICLAGIDNSGKVSKFEKVKNEIEGLDGLVDANLEKILSSGLGAVFDEEVVVIKSPPGFEFIKPSGDTAEFFLRTEEALTSAQISYFIALCLLGHIDRMRKSVGAYPSCIYIDSMSMASIAYALREMLVLWEVENIPKIESFHSHSGMKKVKKPLPGTSFCIISASQSMRMQREWIEHTGCGRDEVATLLTVQDAKDSELALFAVKNIVRDQSACSHPLSPLRITGERFLPDYIPEKEVLLTKDHAITNWFISPRDLSENRVIDLKLNRGEIGSKRAIWCDGEAFIKISEFQDRVKKLIRQKLSISCYTIIYQSDESSKSLAELCKKYIEEIYNREIKLVPQDAVDGADFCSEDSLLIVSAVVGKGTKLLSISRQLRPLHKGAKLYLIGVQICEEASQNDVLKKNLSYSSESAFNHVEICQHYCVGTELNESFYDESRILYRLDLDCVEEIKCRSRCLIEGNSLKSPFLPKPTNFEEMLTLRPDFAFWEKGYQESDSHGAAVLLTLSCILQNAREGRFSSDKSLSSTAYQQVVLSPENFSRYNDGIIQSSLLRAAKSSELNYSGCRLASSRIKEFILACAHNAEKDQGEALMEFGLAYRSGKLKLTANDSEELELKLAPLFERLSDEAAKILNSLFYPASESASMQF